MDETQRHNDIHFMRRCLQLAANGLGRVSPNPLVGCVVVKDGRVVSEGFHQEYGHNHAERNALQRIPDALSRGATLYVNLEPCSHYGQTPPCADLIVEKGIARVVCCNDDPNPLVAGRGFGKLLNAGLEVRNHVLEADGRLLNRRFFTYIEKRRPYIILKWAETADGFMAPCRPFTAKASPSRSYWISSPRQTRLSHKWRTEESAILVGSQTFLDDAPQLTARHWSGSNPKPIVLDRRHRLDTVPSHWLHLHSSTIAQAVDEIHRAGLQSLIVEGGRQVLDAFLSSGIYDEIRVIRSPKVYGNGLKAPHIPPEDADKAFFF